MSQKQRLAGVLALGCRYGKRIWSNDLILAIFLAAFTVIIGTIIGIIGSSHLALNSTAHARYLMDPHNLLNFMANWDGVDYLSIAKHGYTTKFLTGWLPVYPLLIKLLASIIRSYLMSALFISWVALVGAIYYYLKVIKLIFKDTNNLGALKAALLFIFFPTGVYLILAYTESLFAFLLLGAIYYALKKRYFPAAFFLLVATATHINGLYGLILVAVILYEKKVRLINIIKTVIIGSLGLIGYMIYLQIRYRDAFSFISAQRDHGWLHESIISNLHSVGLFNLLLIAAILVAIIYWWKCRKSFAMYSSLFLLIPLIGGQFGGFPRYTLMAFPLQYMLYAISKDKKLLFAAILIIFAAAWIYILLRFSAGYVVN